MWTAENRAVILSERPGITDPTSIAFARESVILGSVSDPERYYVDVLLPEKQAMYVEYVRTRSFGGDIRLLGATFTELVGHGKH
jgi:lipopolysaccharide/colanic/teichoic acid biosynthesis glycosyltransferase